MDLLIGLDIGTTAIKGVLLTVEGRVLTSFTGGYNYYGEDNQKLLNPEEFLETCFSVSDLDIDGKEIMALTKRRGKEIGEALNILLLAVFDEKINYSPEFIPNS